MIDVTYLKNARPALASISWAKVASNVKIIEKFITFGIEDFLQTRLIFSAIARNPTRDVSWSRMPRFSIFF